MPGQHMETNEERGPDKLNQGHEADTQDLITRFAYTHRSDGNHANEPCEAANLG